MALQSFVGPRPLFQFLNLIHIRYDSLDEGSARREAATYIENNINTQQTKTDIHTSSGIRTQDPRVRAKEDSSFFRPHGHIR
jgi:hypothetical protein